MRFAATPYYGMLLLAFMSSLLKTSCAPDKDVSREVETIRSVIEPYFRARSNSILDDRDIDKGILGRWRDSLPGQTLETITTALAIEQDSVQRLRLRRLEWACLNLLMELNDGRAQTAQRSLFELRYGVSLEEMESLAGLVQDSTKAMLDRVGEDATVGTGRTGSILMKEFTGTRAVDAGRLVLRNLGFDNLRRPHLQLADTSWTTHFTTLDIGNEIALAIGRNDGLDSFRDMWSWIGRAVFAASIQEVALEFQNLSDPVVPQAWALLFRDIPASHVWLRQNSSIPIPLLKDAVRDQAILQLTELVRTSSRVQNEIMEFWRREKAGEFNPPSALKETRYLVSRLVAGQLWNYLAQSFGTNWFENHDAGKFLRGLASGGGRLTVQDVLHSIGTKELSFDETGETIKHMLLISTKPTVVSGDK